MTERVWMIVVLALVGSVAIAQDEQADGGEQKQEEAAQEEALPSLDELLGISEDPGVERDSEALDTNRAELERELTDEELGEQFVEAIGRWRRLRTGCSAAGTRVLLRRGCRTRSC